MNANIVDVSLIDLYRKTLTEAGISLNKGDLKNAAAKLNDACVYLGSIYQRKQLDDMSDFDIDEEFKKTDTIRIKLAKRKEDPIYHLEQLMPELVRTENYEEAAKVKKEIDDLKTRLEKQ